MSEKDIFESRKKLAKERHLMRIKRRQKKFYKDL